MDLAEEEDRLRDEWWTHYHRGFLLRATTEPVAGLGRGLVTVCLSARLLAPEPPREVTPEMTHEAQAWVQRWMDFIGRDAASRLIDPINFRPDPWELGPPGTS